MSYRTARHWLTTMTPTLAAALLLTMLPITHGEEAARHNTLTPEQRQAGWKLLFDGENAGEHWRGYNRADLPQGWVAEDGWLMLKDTERGGDIITREKYDAFELYIEWKVWPGSNSGIFYMAREIRDRAIWESAPEYQILDNAVTNHPLHRAGALYDLAGVEDVTKPVGEVNVTRIIVDGDQIVHYLNGQRIVTMTWKSDQWNRLVRDSKFTDPPFASQRLGHIGLQDHGDRVAYRNIRIRPISSE